MPVRLNLKHKAALYKYVMLEISEYYSLQSHSQMAPLHDTSQKCRRPGLSCIDFLVGSPSATARYEGSRAAMEIFANKTCKIIVLKANL